ncbi:MAG TPA: signal peptidase I [Polyangia bacterium]|nr:signal peptidase I [Polyangia bacterium]
MSRRKENRSLPPAEETPDPSRRRRSPIPRPKGKAGGLIELVVIVAIALGLALAIQAWVVKPYKIPSGSMEPTLDVGQRVLVNRFIYHFHEPRIGDIVVFHPPDGVETGPRTECGALVGGRAPLEVGEACPRPNPGESSQTFVKRVVAVGGDTLSVRDGHPVVNGVEKTDEPYIDPCGRASVCDLPKTITIPKGYFFMMGDNRGESDDSRFWGPVPREWIVGEAFATYWPPDRIGGL